MEKAHIFILTDKNMKANGLRIKNADKATIIIRTGIFIKAGGKMIEGAVKGK
jgi:hypothetical protein